MRFGPLSETGASRRESWNSDEGAAHYVRLSNQDEGHAFMGFFDKADMVSSDEDVQDGTMASIGALHSQV